MTDANLIAGRLADGAALGSSVRLNGALAQRALTRVGEVLDLSPEAVAAGIIEIVESHMERAVRVVSIEQGADPRSAELVAFGGAGALHATALARRLDMAGVLVPPHAGVFSAFGLLLAPPRSDVVRGVLLSPGDQALRAAVASVTAEASRRLVEAPEHVDSFADVRYRGQSHEISVPLAAGDSWVEVARRFHDLHRTRNGFARVSDPIEVVAVRAAAIGRPAFAFDQLPSHDATGDPDRGTRPVLESGAPLDAAVVWRPALAVGSEVIGPAVIEEPEATTYLSVGERAIVHESGTLEVSW